MQSAACCSRVPELPSSHERRDSSPAVSVKVGVSASQDSSKLTSTVLPQLTVSSVDVYSARKEDDEFSKHSRMSSSADVDISQPRQKRMKTDPSASAQLGKDENQIPKQCYCFEKSECVVSKLRAKRLEENSSVRRKLDFGPDDSTVTDLAISSKFQEECSKVWNFDFVEETPLPGQWNWVKEDLISTKGVGESEETSSGSAKRKTLKDLFRVSKNRSRKRSVESPFRLPLTPIRSAETSPA